MTSDLLREVLRDVSRSFYLTLRALPSSIQEPIGLAYLMARAADTIADTHSVKAEVRLQLLLQFRSSLSDQASSAEVIQTISEKFSGEISGVTDGEKILLKRLPDCFKLYDRIEESDRIKIAWVVTELTKGMELDLSRFRHPSELRALETFSDLEQYTYHVAGCVGPFWTLICATHLPQLAHWHVEQMSELGIQFGKALQWTNVLRDIPRDLANGRCYLPESDLAPIGLQPIDLTDAKSFSKLKPLYSKYLNHALDHYQASWQYIEAIPASCFRLRLACIWPVWIGLRTIALLRKGNPLDPQNRIKISRGQVYWIMMTTTLYAGIPSLLHSSFKRLLRKARA
jgi:farnesyl-diphosphate farnesyltransferase